MRDLQLIVTSEEGQTCISLASLDGTVLCESTAPALPAPGSIITVEELRLIAWPKDIFVALQQLCRRDRIRLHLSVEPASSALPWEGLQIEDGNPAWIRGPHIPGKLPPKGLRVLLVWSDPASAQYPALPYAEAEAQAVIRAFDGVELRGILIKELPNANERAIENRIRSWRPHVIHFIGHCDVGVLGGYLVTEAGRDTHGEIWGEDLARWTAASGTQLVVISGCCSVLVAQRLSLAGIPAVIGMREPVRDRFAYAFSRAFYAALASRQSIADSVEEARDATRGYGTDSSLPVLFAESEAPFRAEEYQTNLPVYAQPFIGRTRQRVELAGLLTTRASRLITIHGMGGMGKTRLSVQVGRDLLHHYTDGVWFVECDNLTGEDQLIAAIAAAVGAPATQGTEGICEYLGSSRALLVADCFEKLVLHSGVLSQILALCPNTDILVSSRIALDHSFAYKLDPLADRKQSTPSERLELLESSVRTIDPQFRISRANARVCREIVMLLQGVPLAILLAAGRTRHISLEQLRDRLKESLLDILTRNGGKRDRHASMRIVVEDSFELLPLESRQLATKLSVFAGGFTMADARAVLPEERKLEDGVFVLCDHSLLTVHGTGMETRYKALDTIREFLSDAAKDLDFGAIECRHMTHFADRAVEVMGKKRKGSWKEASEFLRENLGNFLESWRIAVRNGESVILRRLAGSLSRPFLEIGLRKEFLDIATEGLRQAQQAGDLQMESELTGLLASQAGRDGRYKDAEALWRRKLELCERLGDEEMAAEIHLDLALMFVRANVPIDGLRAIDEIDFSKHRSIHADALSLKAQILAQLGSAAASESAAEEAVRVSEVEPALSRRFFHMNLAVTHFLLDQPALSLVHAKQLLSIGLEYAFDQPIGEALLLISKCLLAQDLPDRAAQACWAAMCMPRAAAMRVWNEARALAAAHDWSTPSTRESKTWPQPARQTLNTL